MKTDFTVTIHDVDKPLAVRIKVHDNLGALRSAVTQRMSKEERRKNNFKPEECDAICERFHIAELLPVCAIVRFAEPNIGAGIVAHEMTHAAVWMWEIKHRFKPTPIANDHDDEEWFAWILGELVRRTTCKLYERGIYT